MFSRRLPTTSSTIKITINTFFIKPTKTTTTTTTTTAAAAKTTKRTKTIAIIQRTGINKILEQHNNNKSFKFLNFQQTMTMSTYQAVSVDTFGGPDVLKVKSLPMLKITSPAQILVNVKCAGVNPVDTYIRSGTYVRKPALPYTPGADAAGVVVEVADDVTAYKQGDRVWLTGSETGTYASHCLARVDQVHKLPDHVCFESGAALNVPYRTAFRAVVQKAKVKAGESILIHGASGGVGIAVVQFAKLHGLTVYGTAGNESGCRFLLEQGCDFAFNHNETGYLDKLITCGGVNVIIEMLANVNLDRDLKALQVGGRVVVVGNRGNIEICPRDLMAKESCVMGVALAKATPEEVKESIAAINGGLDAKCLKPVIGNKFSLEDSKTAHDVVINQSGGTRGKVVITLE